MPVTGENTAVALGSGSVEVFATPAMIALLEAAAVDAIQARLPESMTSVGTRLDVRHTAATPVGMTIAASATLTEIDGRRLVFDVSASDDVEVIGEGIHERFIVDRARFEQRVRDKQANG